MPSLKKCVMICAFQGSATLFDLQSFRKRGVVAPVYKTAENFNCRPRNEKKGGLVF